MGLWVKHRKSFCSQSVPNNNNFTLSNCYTGEREEIYSDLEKKQHVADGCNVQDMFVNKLYVTALIPGGGISRCTDASIWSECDGWGGGGLA